MNRKLKKALKDIYASEQPEHMNEFIHQLPKQQSEFRFAAPVMAVLALGTVIGYGYLHARQAYQPYQSAEQKTSEEAIQIKASETVMTTAESIEVVFYTGTFPVTTAPEESETLPETENEIIFPVTETAVSSTTSKITTAQTTVTTVTTTVTPETHPETEIIAETEPEIIMTEPVTEPMPEEEIITQIHWPVQTVPETSVTETIPETTEIQTETTKNSFYSGIEDMTLSAKIDEMQFEYFTHRHNEVLDWGFNGTYYENEREIADTMISEFESLYQENENPFYPHYCDVISAIKETDFGYPEDAFFGSTAQWTAFRDGYQNLLAEEVTQIEQYLTEHDELTELENFRESQENFILEYENFWNADDYYYEYSNSMKGYMNAVLIQGRVVFLMNYFDYFQ